MINNLCNKLAYTYTGILAFLVFLFYGVTPGHTENLFVLKSSALQTLAPKFMEFNEELDETANEKELDRALWTPKLKTYQSFVTGYWVRFSIRNNTENRFIGLNHNWNKEKKLFVISAGQVTEYPYWKYRRDPPFDDGRFLSQYKIEIPPGETAIVYNFFRSNPFDRYYATVGGLDRVTIGSWENIRFREYFRVGSSIAFISVGLAFGLYFLFVFLVSGGTYLWLSLTLFVASAIALLTQARLINLPTWTMTSEINLCFYALLFIFLVQFFRKSLEVREKYRKTDIIFGLIIVFYIFTLGLNFYTGLYFPGDPHFDLIKYPPDNQGPGLIKLRFLVLPFLLCLIISIILSLMGWLKGSGSAKFIFISFMLPFLAIPITLITYVFYGFTWITMLVGTTSSGFLFLFMFITFGFAVAQQINELRQLALLQQIQLTQAYQRFVPKQLLQNLKKDSILDVKLGDQVNMEMSIMFSDIRSFTTISEKMTPKENFGFVNSYLNKMGPIVRTNRGYIDKFMGDGIMAIFPESPSDAVGAAIKMQHELNELNKSDVYNKNPISIGIGINTGMMMLGTIGEDDRMEGSVISDAVNLADRLEELTKVYKAKILISEDTATNLKIGSFSTRLVDVVAVKGRAEAVRVFEVLDGELHDIYTGKIITKPIFSKAFDLYQAQKIEEAFKLFSECKAKNPTDGAVDYYIQYCEQLIEKGWNSETWDGVNRRTIK